MAPGFKRKSNYKSDDFVASDDEDAAAARPSKKGKTGGSEFKPSLEPQTDSSGDKYWEISKQRRVTINDFRGKSLISVREYYEKDGESLPGKKGISMTVEQYSALINLMPQIEAMLSAKGESVPRPDYDGTAPAGTGVEDAEIDDDDPKKANIEATSDEEE